MTTTVRVQYAWAESGWSKPENVQLVGERLAEIADRNGMRLTPDAVVQDAQAPSSPLHHEFEWDDPTAAHEWRRQQARQLINSVRVVEQTPQGGEVQRIAYVSIQDEGNRAYMPYYVVAATPDYKDFALKDAQRYLDGFERRYGHLEAMQPVVQAIRRVRKRQSVNVGSQVPTKRRGAKPGP